MLVLQLGIDLESPRAVNLSICKHLQSKVLCEAPIGDGRWGKGSLSRSVCLLDLWPKSKVVKSFNIEEKILKCGRRLMWEAASYSPFFNTFLIFGVFSMWPNNFCTGPLGCSAGRETSSGKREWHAAWGVHKGRSTGLSRSKPIPNSILTCSCNVCSLQ